jgi:transposase, IS30 family
MKGQYTQLTLNDRQLIEHMLNEKKSLSHIASLLHRDPSGLRREIKHHRSEWKKANQGSYLNDCAHTTSCQKRFICGGLCTFRGRPCRSCSLCNEPCEDFKLEVCSRLIRTPYVCNGCPTRHYCKHTKHFISHHWLMINHQSIVHNHGWVMGILQFNFND